MLVKCLEAEGVEHIFGYPGGAVLNIYDALFDSNICHILVRHEQGAAHAADGYARATGKVGVCLATSGPGATNLVTGLATAYMDSIPIVAFTGQVATGLIGKDSFQEADIFGITLPITKHSFLVKNLEDLPFTIKAAFKIAREGRPGPVLIDLPRDIMAAKGHFRYPEKICLPGFKPVYDGHPEQIAQAVRLIQESSKPVIYAGGGVIASGAARHLLELAELIQAPVTTTLMGLGAFPGDHPLFLGMLGMHGTVAANFAVSHCDLLIAIGCRFDDRVTGKIEEFAPGARIIHIDIDPAEIGKNVRVDVPIVGDVGRVLSELNSKLVARAPGDWLATVEAWKENHPLRYSKEGEGIKPQYVVEELRRQTRGMKVKITTEVGQNQMWAAQYFTFTEPRSLITSGGLGTMGFGLPAAIGAAVACPDHVVIDIAGDGSIQMNSQELATAVQYNLPVKVVILNNGYLGMVRQWQELFYNRRYSQVDMSWAPDFIKLAEAYGAKGLRATRPEEVPEVLATALATPGPVVVDIVVDREENVLPMVPPGGALHKMIGG
ncbi:acetolactate synthase, large subunit [Carboxydocella sporoproducens DSM 16521]|uniref:Acetolactate synthase n=3 Tax=Clostridiales Family XVI. Incertae Sedis TaxID=543347 RepID=A0A1T4L7U5_9FIRM|nr:acetolactate synthase, large subunit [Carboxydocella thermautotrophica]AVX30343.1 acetolactate synthase, large subunit [Carboxydocella thermautotrophica]SJZ50782.1 acetolactate synthase, large subunit [Carboxydocella sporoproducens DSM 16521]